MVSSSADRVSAAERWRREAAASPPTEPRTGLSRTDHREHGTNSSGPAMTDNDLLLITSLTAVGVLIGFVVRWRLSTLAYRHEDEAGHPIPGPAGGSQ